MRRIIAFILIVSAWNLSSAQDGRPDLNGVWLAAPGTIGGVEFGEMGALEPPKLTPAAEQLRDDYDRFVDDPAFQCSPGSVNRVWSNPVPIEIEQQADRVILRYEYMDGLRTVYLDGRSSPPDAPRHVLGHSVGRYEGSTLVIETSNFARSTIGAVTGTPQSEELRVIERLTLSPDSQLFSLEIRHEDPGTFTEPWTSTRDFTLRDMERLSWDCVLEDAGYEEFNTP